MFHLTITQTIPVYVSVSDINITRQAGCSLAFVSYEEIPEQDYSRSWKCPSPSETKIRLFLCVSCKFAEPFWACVGKNLFSFVFQLFQASWAVWVHCFFEEFPQKEFYPVKMWRSCAQRSRTEMRSLKNSCSNAVKLAVYTVIPQCRSKQFLTFSCITQINKVKIFYYLFSLIASWRSNGSTLHRDDTEQHTPVLCTWAHSSCFDCSHKHSNRTTFRRKERNRPTRVDPFTHKMTKSVTIRNSCSRIAL
jgi:hypothetical protein